MQLPKNIPKTLNVHRRTLLKAGALGVVAFALGKILGPGMNWLGGGDSKVFNFQNFRVVENGQELGFYDRMGNEILVMDKE